MFWLLASLFMTLEEKAGQVLMPHFVGDHVNEDARCLVEEIKVGGIIYYAWANGLESIEETRALSDSLQALARLPLLIATDQEGVDPNNRGTQLAKFILTRDPEEVAERMRAAGIMMNFAPVVDVNSNPMNPVIGARALGDTPEEVCAKAQEILDGYARGGIIATLKHFPGHGDTDVDSHYGLPVVNKTREELEACELVPYYRLNAPAIMSAHVLLPALDETWCATVSKKILGMLRNEMGFDGLIVSDSLLMQGVRQQCGSMEEAAVRALDAGCDLLVLSGFLIHSDERVTVDDVRRVRDAIVKAVDEGRLSEARLDDAVERILKLK